MAKGKSRANKRVLANENKGKLNGNKRQTSSRKRGRSSAAKEVASPGCESPREKLNKSNKSAGKVRKRLNFIKEPEQNNDETCTGQNNNATALVDHNLLKSKTGDGIDIAVETGDDELDYEFTEEKEDQFDSSDGSSDHEVEINQTKQQQNLTQEEKDKKLLEDNPSLKRLFNQMLDERIKQATKSGEGSKSTLLTSLSPCGATGNSGNKPNGGPLQSRVTKSPSDTTIYTPALGRKNNRNNQTDVTIGQRNALVSNTLSNHIDRFVEEVRTDTEGRERSRTGQSKITIPGYDEAKKRTEQAIIEAEKFKASVATPPGRNAHISMEELIQNLPSREVQMISNNEQHHIRQSFNEQMAPRPMIGGTMDGLGGSDNDFFHLICHIDQNLKQKIEKGEYVELDRLLSKDRFNALGSQNDGQGEFERLEWVRNENGTFLMPAKRANRINSFRKWKQAFRIYATIYCSANPTRAREIWQYISVINTAASAFIWKMCTTTMSYSGN